MTKRMNLSRISEAVDGYIKDQISSGISLLSVKYVVGFLKRTKLLREFSPRGSHDGPYKFVAELMEAHSQCELWDKSRGWHDHRVRATQYKSLIYRLKEDK